MSGRSLARTSRSRIGLLLGAVFITLLFAAVAYADNVVDNVTIGGNDTITAGGTTAVGYKINANGGDGQAGCNASDGSPATISLNIPSGVTATSADATWNASTKSLTFSACSDFKTINFSAAVAGDYAISVANISDSGVGSYANQANWTLHVLAPAKQNQTITFPAISDKTYGDADFNISATATSGLGVTFTFLGPCEASATGQVHLTGAGTCTITAAQIGDSNYNAASSVPQSFQIAKASATLALSNLDQTYDGSAKSATVTTTPSGVSGVSVTYDGSTTAPTNAGSYAVVASLTNANYTTGDATGTLVIAKASATLTLSNLNATYDGTAKPVTATTSPAGLSVVTVTYDGSATEPTNVGSYAVVASLSNPNYAASNATGTLVIGKADQAITFAALGDKSYGDAAFAVSASGGGSGNPVMFTATGNCTATGTNGTTVTITGAGSCTLTADQAGNGNYDASPAVARTFAIAKAGSTTTVTCPAAAVTYDGSAQTPCTAKATGVGGLNETLTVGYTDNTNAGTAHASASFAGDGNHTASSDSATFAIAKASSTAVVTCPATAVTYDGSAQTPCTAKATGVAGLNETLTVGYTDNTNAGTAHASASFAGDANHTASSDSATFAIEKASSTTVVTCPVASLIYNGDARTPCAAAVTGAGGLNETLTVSYTDNTNAGTAHAAASYAGDANHTASSDSETFAIEKATSTVFATWVAWTYDGTAHPATGSVNGVGTPPENLGTPTFVYYGGSTATGTPLAGAPSTVGTYTVVASFAGNANYKPASATKTILVSYRWDGFLQPINDTAHQTGVAQSKFRLGQTIPAKFVIKELAGTVVQQATDPTFTRSGRLGSCDSTTELETITELLTPDSTATYTWDGNQYHYQYNWSTKGLTAGEYRIYANLADGTKRYVDICLTK